MNQRIAKMQRHTILCGFGRVGRQIAEDLQQAGIEFVVIDRQDESGELARGVIPHIIGAAELEEILLAAGIGQARVLISAVDSDTENVFIALSARDLNSTIRIIARASNSETVRKLELVGADRVVSPYTTSGRRMAHLALHPAATDVFDVLGGPLGGLSVELQQLELRGGELVGRSLSELDLRRRSGALVVALATEGRLEMNPDPGRRLRAGDVLTVLGTEEQCLKLHEMNV
jgi:voltage-gated potassium channel